MRIVCYGDSNTFGYDPQSFFGGRYPHRWPELLAEKTGHEILNFGQNGRAIPCRERDIASAAEMLGEQKADILIIMLGSNDLLLGADAAETAQRMERFIGAVDMKKKDILLIAPPPMQYGEWASEENILAESRRLAREYHALAEKLGTGFADAGEWKLPIAYDGVHLSEEAHRIFADQICGYI